MKKNKKFGYVSLIGCPNAGKSTLLNQLIGTKISIVTPKAQTTRNIVNGILTEDNCQIVFIDTPGIFEPKKTLDKAMVRAAWAGVTDSDIVCFILDSKKGITESNRKILLDLKKRKIRAVLILNKIDLLKNKEQLLNLAKELNEQDIFEKIFMISALTGDGIEGFKQYIFDNIKEGDWHYSDDDITTASMKFLASEIVREKLFLHLDKELPYRISVETEMWENLNNGSSKVHQVIYVSKISQKQIILGHKGEMIKKVGLQARKELENILGQKIHLFLHVKVKENWETSRDTYNYLGIEFPKE